MSITKQAVQLLVEKFYSEYVSNNEMLWLVEGYTMDDNPSLTHCKQYIYKSIINQKARQHIIQFDTTKYTLEQKEARLLTKKWIQSIIEDYVNKQYKERQWVFPHEKE